jgi:hypothetical protein
MNWSIYGWVLLALHAYAVVKSGATPKVHDANYRFAARMFWLAFSMPLIGHLIGWW